MQAVSLNAASTTSPSLQSFSLQVLMRSGTPAEKKHAQRIAPVQLTHTSVTTPFQNMPLWVPVRAHLISMSNE